MSVQSQLPSRYQNADTRPADCTKIMVEIYDLAGNVDNAIATTPPPAGSVGVGQLASDAIALINTPIADYAALRSYANSAKSVYVTGYLTTSSPSGIAGVFVRDDHDTTSADNGGTIIVSGAVRWKRQFGGAYDVRWFGAKVDGTTDDYTALQLAVTAAPRGSVIYFPPGTCKSTGTIQISVRNITFRGSARENTSLKYVGNGVAIQLGTDDGLDWDAGNYNGVAQGFGFEYMTLTCGNSGAAGQLTTPLLNTITAKSYGTGTYGIRDWRGGSLRLVRAQIDSFENGLWGVQSDLNYGQDLIISYNRVGVFLGPRSDQPNFDHVWSFGNDTVWILEGNRQSRITHWTTDTDGSATTAPAIIRNSTPALSARYSTTRVQSGNVFEHPWAEQLGSLGVANPGYDVPYVFDVNIGDADQGGGLVINNPIVVTFNQSDPTVPHFSYLVRAGYVKSVEVNGCSGFNSQVSWGNTKAIFYIDASTPAPARIYFSDSDNQFGSRLIENHNATATFMQSRTDGFSNFYLVNSLGGTGTVNIGYLGLNRALTGDSSPMSTGAAGNIILNRGFGTSRSLGWVWSGTSAVVIHAPTIGSDRGDAAGTLTPETDHEDQVFSTSLTSDRDWVLAAPPASSQGYRFRITRSAAGAFNLNVKNLTGGGTLIKAMPATSWADFAYDGANWILRAYGPL